MSGGVLRQFPVGGAGWYDLQSSDLGSANTITSAHTVGARAGRACRVSDTVGAWLYNTGSDSGTLRLAVANTSGSSAAIDVASGSVNAFLESYNIERVSDTKVIVTYGQIGQGATLKTYTISGVTPSLDATLTIGTTSNTEATAAVGMALSSTTGFVVYNNGTNKVAQQLSIGSGTLTATGSASASLGSNNATVATRLKPLTSTTALFASYDTAVSDYRVGVLTYANPPTFSSITVNTRISAFNKISLEVSEDGTEAVLFVADRDSGNDGEAVAFTISGSTVTEQLHPYADFGSVSQILDIQRLEKSTTTGRTTAAALLNLAANEGASSKDGAYFGIVSFDEDGDIGGGPVKQLSTYTSNLGDGSGAGVAALTDSTCLAFFATTTNGYPAFSIINRPS